MGFEIQGGKHVNGHDHSIKEIRTGALSDGGLYLFESWRPADWIEIFTIIIGFIVFTWRVSAKINEIETKVNMMWNAFKKDKDL